MEKTTLFRTFSLVFVIVHATAYNIAHITNDRITFDWFLLNKCTLGIDVCVNARLHIADAAACASCLNTVVSQAISRNPTCAEYESDFCPTLADNCRSFCKSCLPTAAQALQCVAASENCKVDDALPKCKVGSLSETRALVLSSALFCGGAVLLLLTAVAFFLRQRKNSNRTRGDSLELDIVADGEKRCTSTDEVTTAIDAVDHDDFSAEVAPASVDPAMP